MTSLVPVSPGDHILLDWKPCCLGFRGHSHVGMYLPRKVHRWKVAGILEFAQITLIVPTGKPGSFQSGGPRSPICMVGWSDVWTHLFFFADFFRNLKGQSQLLMRQCFPSLSSLSDVVCHWAWRYVRGSDPKDSGSAPRFPNWLGRITLKKCWERRTAWFPEKLHGYPPSFSTFPPLQQFRCWRNWPWHRQTSPTSSPTTHSHLGCFNWKVWPWAICTLPWATGSPVSGWNTHYNVCYLCRRAWVFVFCWCCGKLAIGFWFFQRLHEIWNVFFI